MSGWVRLPQSEQLREICLFLLIWGEAANLRFMPELLHTIFEVVRSYVPDGLPTSTPTADVEPGAFLRRTVRPIYDAIHEADRTAKLRSGHLHDKENYDDWNEAFWRRKGGLLDLRTVEGSVCIFAQAPPDRWAYLQNADWHQFFHSKARKTHREKRWWTCLLAANRRVFLLHFITFFFLVFWTVPSIEVRLLAADCGGMQTARSQRPGHTA
jgi:1,3-beta-glucan synthase